MLPEFQPTAPDGTFVEIVLCTSDPLLDHLTVPPLLIVVADGEKVPNGKEAFSIIETEAGMGVAVAVAVAVMVAVAVIVAVSVAVAVIVAVDVAVGVAVFVGTIAG